MGQDLVPSERELGDAHSDTPMHERMFSSQSFRVSGMNSPRNRDATSSTARGACLENDA